MKAIVDILTEANLYSFMAVKEQLILAVENELDETPYKDMYAISGSFSSTDQTISVVVGLLAQQGNSSYLSSMVGDIASISSPEIKEYVYGINVTGINDEEVNSIVHILYRRIIESYMEIGREAGAKIHPSPYMTPIASGNIGEKRVWSSTIYVSAGTSEVSVPRNEVSSWKPEETITSSMDIKEIYVQYLNDIIAGTEYEGAIDIGSDWSNVNSTNAIVVGTQYGQDRTNAYNGAIGYKYMRGVKDINLAREVDVVIDIALPDNDALWMLGKYISAKIREDSRTLSSVSGYRISSPANMSSVTPKDLGARSVWSTRISVPSMQAMVVNTNEYNKEIVSFEMMNPAPPRATKQRLPYVYDGDKIISIWDSGRSVAIPYDIDGATIYYTVDGKVPTSASPIYNEPITVGLGTTIIYVIAKKDGWVDSGITKLTVYAGDGTISHPYPVCSSQDMNNIRTDLSASYIQMCNIDMAVMCSTMDEGRGWLPIGGVTPHEDNPFTGTYDGNNNVISGIRRVNRENDYADGTIAGMFGNTNGATIKNIYIKDSVFDDSLASPLIANFARYTRIENVHIWDTKVSGDQMKSGLVNMMADDSIMTRCSSSVYARLDTCGYGGLCSSIEGSEISDSWAIVDAKYEHDIVDKAWQSDSFCGIAVICAVSTIKNTYAKGVVSGRLWQSGFVQVTDMSFNYFGAKDSNTIENCYAAVQLISNANTLPPPHYVEDPAFGGFSVEDGMIIPLYDISNYFDYEVAGTQDTAMATPKTTEEMKNIDTYIGWDFVSKWTFTDDNSYPSLINNPEDGINTLNYPGRV